MPHPWGPSRARPFARTPCLRTRWQRELGSAVSGLGRRLCPSCSWSWLGRGLLWEHLLGPPCGCAPFASNPRKPGCGMIAWALAIVNDAVSRRGPGARTMSVECVIRVFILNFLRMSMCVECGVISATPRSNRNRTLHRSKVIALIFPRLDVLASPLASPRPAPSYTLS